MSTPSSSPALESSPPLPPSRRFSFASLANAVALFGLTLALTFLIDLFLLANVIHAGLDFRALGSQGNARALQFGVAIAMVLFVGAAIAITWLISRLALRTVRGWVCLLLAVAGIVIAGLWVVVLVPTVYDGFLAFRLLGDPSVRMAGSTIFLIAVILGCAAHFIRGKTIRSAVMAVLLAALLLILFQLILTALYLHPRTFGGLFNLGGRPEDQSLRGFLLAIALVGLIPLGLVIALHRLRRRSVWWLGGGYLAAAPVFVYLATDDAEIRRPVTMEEIAPAFPGAEKSYAVAMRYGINQPLGRKFRAPERMYGNPITRDQSIDSASAEKWARWLIANRPGIESDWAELAPVRAWMDELNTFDRIADLTPTRVDAEFMGFSPFRSVMQHACAIAALQALDGHGDDAVATLIPLLQVGRKLQPSARTLLRFQIGIIGERMSLQALTFVLDRTTISPSTRSRLVAALSAPGGGAAGARRLVAIEYTFSLNTLLAYRLGDIVSSGAFYSFRAAEPLRRVLNLAGPFLYNPRATFNLYGALSSDLEELIGTRQLAQMEARQQQFAREDTRPRFKNFMGSQIMHQYDFVYTKVAENYWQTQDRRAALLERVSKL